MIGLKYEMTGGANGLFPYLVAALTGIPLVDADCIAHAFPGINMTTPAVYNGISRHVAELANIDKAEVIEATDPLNLEEKTHLISDTRGGTAYITYIPMKADIAKKVCIPATLSIAHEIGRTFFEAKRQGKDPLLSLNLFLEKTDYKKANEIYKGKVTELRRIERFGFSVGGFVVSDGTKHLS